MSTATTPRIDASELDVSRIRALRGPKYWRLAPVIASGGAVTFVDASAVRFNNMGDVEKGSQLTISALRVGSLAPARSSI